MRALRESVERRLPIALGLLAAVAAAIGLYARFAGLSVASLAPDEYYIVRSVQNILQFGWPEYACGGIYPRAIAYQYLVAGAGSLGVDLVTAARAIAAISSVLALPLAYWLAHRVGGRLVALVAVIVLALSLWETEVARFARMYAPFQCVFLAYLVCYVRLVVDQVDRAVWPLLGLSVLGVLVWEGGAFLALLSLTVPFVRDPKGALRWRDVLFLALNVALLYGFYKMLISEVRFSGEQDPFPKGYDQEQMFDVSQAAIGAADTLRAPWKTLAFDAGRFLGWWGAALLPLTLAALSLRYIFSLRTRWPAAAALLLALVLALAHQFAAVAMVLLAAVLARLVDIRELSSRPARIYLFALGAALVFWLAFASFTSEWHAGVSETWLGGNPRVWAIYELVRFPDVLLQIARPWLNAVPWLSAGLAALLGTVLVREISRHESQSTARVLLLVVVCLFAAVGASLSPRQETRYVFFLYPVFIVLAVHAVFSLLRRPGVAVASAASLALFAASEDFRLRHLLSIDSLAASVRLDLPKDIESHVVPRTDVRGAAAWLDERDARDSGSTTRSVLRINAYPSADYYYPDFDLAYIDFDSSRFRAYSCREGTTERWGNLPLIYAMDTLHARIASQGGAWIVIDARARQSFARGLASLDPRVVWTSIDGELEILAVGRTGT